MAVNEGEENQQNISLSEAILVIVYIWASVKIVRTGLRPGDRQRHYPLRFHRDNVILVLQGPFHHEKLLRSHQQTVFLKQVGHDDGIGDSGLVLQAEKNEALGGSGTLPCDDASANT